MGSPRSPPRYYDDWVAKNHPEVWEEVRKSRARERDSENQTPSRLQVREVCARARLNLYRQRELEAS